MISRLMSPQLRRRPRALGRLATSTKSLHQAFMLPALVHGRHDTIAPTDDYKQDRRGAGAATRSSSRTGNNNFRRLPRRQRPRTTRSSSARQDPKEPAVWDLAAQKRRGRAGPSNRRGRSRARVLDSFRRDEHPDSRAIVLQRVCPHRVVQLARAFATTRRRRGLGFATASSKENDDGLTGGTQDSEATSSSLRVDSNGHLNA